MVDIISPSLTNADIDRLSNRIKEELNSLITPVNDTKKWICAEIFVRGFVCVGIAYCVICAFRLFNMPLSLLYFMILPYLLMMRIIIFYIPFMTDTSPIDRAATLVLRMERLQSVEVAMSLKKMIHGKLLETYTSSDGGVLLRDEQGVSYVFSKYLTDIPISLGGGVCTIDLTGCDKVYKDLENEDLKGGKYVRNKSESKSNF